MTFFCTYCSKEKNQSDGKLPAIERYLSSRINSIYAAAMNCGLDFLILSGEYGILKPCDLIPNYSHLLQPTEVDKHSKLVASQLIALGVKDLIFFSRPDSIDANVRPYIECIKIACHLAKIELKFIYLLK
jgi:hypothetical protein